MLSKETMLHLGTVFFGFLLTGIGSGVNYVVQASNTAESTAKQLVGIEKRMDAIDSKLERLLEQRGRESGR